MHSKYPPSEGLKLHILEELQVPKVPPSEQEHFAELVTENEYFYAMQLESLRQAKHCFQTLLHQGFPDGA